MEKKKISKAGDTAQCLEDKVTFAEDRNSAGSTHIRRSVSPAPGDPKASDRLGH